MNIPRLGINASRRIGSGGGNSNIAEEIRNIRSSGNAPLLQVAVVVEVIYDPTSLTDDYLNNLANIVANPVLLGTMPRNTILARIISDAHDIGDASPRIFYPLFSSHFQLPIKAGEQVFVLYADPHLNANEIGYWVTRVPEGATVEDLNYTHGDRKYDPNLNPDNISTSDRASTNNNNYQPGFPNGGATPESISLFLSSARDRPYETIFTGSNANKQFTPEPVPRYFKRPGEFAIQGSNNARIVLGEDRTGPATRVTQSNQITDKTNFAGAIDIVAGVGGIRHFPQTTNDDPSVANHNPTAPRVIQNTRNFLEVDKAPFLNRKNDNALEGDPDFQRDLSRIYVAMKTAGDKNFKINAGGDGGIYPNSDNKLNTQLQDLASGDQDGQPFAVIKSEHVRIIGTGKNQDNGPTESGDIRIIKEGKATDDKDLAMLVFNKEGEVIAVGKNIQLVTHEDGKVFINCKDDQESNSDPMILFSKFKELEQEVQNKINSLRDGIANNIQQYIQQSCVVQNATSPFGPVPAIVTMNALVTNLANQIKAIDTDFTNKIDPCKSKWVFLNKENQG